MRLPRAVYVVSLAMLVQSCGGGSNPTGPEVTEPPVEPPVVVTPDDNTLQALIAANGLTGDPSIGRALPNIGEPLAQLGKKLFFTQALGGDFDSACASCHHPVLGGGDALSLPFGVGSIDPNLLGPGRGDVSGLPNVPRNAPTTFNAALWDSALFMDSRVESLGKEVGQNGSASGISTPDSGLGVLDSDAGADLAVAQARFPVTSVEEMRGTLLPGGSNASLRDHLAARIGDFGTAIGEIGSNSWLSEFRTAFQSSAGAEALITFENIVAALGAYERSQVFVDSPWRAYVQGDFLAISDAAKRGAILFYTAADEQGGGCVQCHSGDMFTDEQHHTIGAPQFGPGKGNVNNHDFGRENITANAAERFRLRTPSLLNIEVTGPFMHTGAYESLNEVLAHYNNPNGTVSDFFDDGAWCQLQQFETVANCASLYPNARLNSNQALAKTNNERNANDPAALPNINLNGGERNDIIAFLRTLTDPCVVSRTCLTPWIPDPQEAADDHQLQAVDVNGNLL